jgi:PleD family two-component response regulator
VTEPSAPRDILIVDDEAKIRHLVGDLCRAMGVRTHAVEDGLQAMELLRAAGAPDIQVILLDLVMPRMNGFDVLLSLREEPLASNPGVVVLTSMGEPEGKAEATRLGAIDFVVKPFRVHDLRRRIERALAIIDLERRLERAAQRLQILRDTDEVTGVGATAALFHVLEAEFHAAQENGTVLTCAVVSDEGYDRTLGMAGVSGGTTRLQVVAELIGQRLREGDRVFRVDAAEFVVLLPGLAQDAAETLLRGILDDGAAHEDLGPRQLAVGLAAYPHPEIHQAGLLYRAANLALARARTGSGVRAFEAF